MKTVSGAGFDAAPAEATVLDADGTILVVNGAWRRFAENNQDTHPDHWIGENSFDVCGRADTDPRATEALDGLAAVLAGARERFRLEYPCHSPGEQRWFMLDAAAFTFDGEPHLFVCHFDITERKLAEREAAARTEHLETVIEVLGHDIRNPLQVIDGYAERIAADLEDTNDIDRIRRAAARITEITEATLTLSQAGALSAVEPLAVEALADDAWERASTADTSLTIEGSTTVHGDRRLLLRLVENLFRNAVEHAGPTCAVRVGPLQGGFYVADDGPGIPEAIREKALESDYSTQGTNGVGLPTVQAVVTAHGGDLRITDAAGGGTRFEITGIDVAPDKRPPPAHP